MKRRAETDLSCQGLEFGGVCACVRGSGCCGPLDQSYNTVVFVVIEAHTFSLALMC
jgi:hypothetical protein